jgi:hypothetical protein
MSRRRAKRILQEAVPHVSDKVVVISEDFLSTSLSVNSAREIEANITLVNEALKKLRRWHRVATAKESAACSPA